MATETSPKADEQINTAYEHAKPASANRTTSREVAPRHVKIPVSIMTQLEERLPISGVPNRTIGLHKAARCVIVDQLIRMLGSRHGKATFNVRLCRAMQTKAIAAKASEFLQACDGVDLAIDYSAGSVNPHGRIFVLSSDIANPILNDHHTYSPYTMGIPTRESSMVSESGVIVTSGHCHSGSDSDTDGIRLGLWGFSDFEVPEAYFGRELRWCGATCDFVFLPGWHDDTADRYHSACALLYPGHFDWRESLQTGFAALEPMDEISLAECVALVREKHPEISDDAVAAKAEPWQRVWQDLRKHGISWSFRKAGRLYYPIVMLPKVLRKRLVFDSGTTEIDLKSTYWAILAGWLEPGSCRDKLIADLESREFYARLNRQLEMPLPDALAKSSINRDGLFGVEESMYSPYGQTDYYAALDRAYPDLMRMIASMRRGPYGVTNLAEKLMKAESRIFIDGGLQWCEQCGIPALPIHDCLMVPSAYADVVLGKLQAIAEEQLGYAPEFDVSASPATAMPVCFA